MKIVLATGNKGKIKEFEKLLPNNEIIAFKKLLGNIEIVEDKKTFKGNAIKKAKTIYDLLKDEKSLVISDDSGISVPLINNEPGIYSARYANLKATDKENNLKLISKLNEKNVEKTDAYYTCCISIVYKNEIYSVHGFMYGQVINKELGDNGFGYDPMFIPKGYNKTLGQLSYDTKKAFSHRAKACNLALKVLETIL